MKRCANLTNTGHPDFLGADTIVGVALLQLTPSQAAQQSATRPEARRDAVHGERAATDGATATRPESPRSLRVAAPRAPLASCGGGGVWRECVPGHTDSFPSARSRERSRRRSRPPRPRRPQSVTAQRHRVTFPARSTCWFRSAVRPLPTSRSSSFRAPAARRRRPSTTRRKSAPARTRA